MQVCFDVTWMNTQNDAGGTFQYALRLISALTEHTDLNVVVIMGPAGAGIFDSLRVHENFTSIPLQPLQSFSDVIKSERIDVIHTPLQLHLNYTLSAPMITTLHDLQHFHYPRFFTPEEIQFRNLHYKGSAEFSERVIVSFEHVKEDIIKFYDIPGERIEVCPVGFPPPKEINPRRLAEFKKRYRLGERYLFYSANTWPHKNHIGLIKALKVLHDRYQMKIPLLCTGYQYDDYFPKILSTVKELGLGKFVQFTGYIPEDEMLLLLKNATVVVIPTLYEAGSFPLMEAMAYEVPVICSDVTSLPLTIGDPKFVFDPNDVEQMAEKIAALLQDEKLIEENRRNSREKATENSWDKVIVNFVRVYEKTVESFDRKRRMPFYRDWIQNYEFFTNEKMDQLRRKLARVQKLAHKFYSPRTKRILNRIGLRDWLERKILGTPPHLPGRP